MAGRLPGLQLLLVIEIGGRVLLAEEQPVGPFRPTCLSFFEEGPERRNAGAGADHDYRHAVVLGQAKVLRHLREDGYLQRLRTVGKEA
ncbi:hypothetical protein D3C75_550730 [compost metagenome]